MAIRDRLTELRALRQSNDKFSKGQAYYIEDSYQTYFNCRDCFHFREGECNLVSEEGSPGPGRISPGGTCSLFNARPPRVRTLQMMWGRGDLNGIAPERARATSFMFTYAFLGEDPPQDLKERSLLDFETVQSIAQRSPSSGRGGLY